jgi:hypothetical protein
MLGTFGLIAYTFPWLAFMFVPIILYLVSTPVKGYCGSFDFSGTGGNLLPQDFS